MTKRITRRQLRKLIQEAYDVLETRFTDNIPDIDPNKGGTAGAIFGGKPGSARRTLGILDPRAWGAFAGLSFAQATDPVIGQKKMGGYWDAVYKKLGITFDREFKKNPNADPRSAKNIAQIAKKHGNMMMSYYTVARHVPSQAEGVLLIISPQEIKSLMKYMKANTDIGEDVKVVKMNDMQTKEATSLKDIQTGKSMDASTWKEYEKETKTKGKAGDIPALFVVQKSSSGGKDSEKMEEAMMSRASLYRKRYGRY